MSRNTWILVNNPVFQLHILTATFLSEECMCGNTQELRSIKHSSQRWLVPLETSRGKAEKATVGEAMAGSTNQFLLCDVSYKGNHKTEEEEAIVCTTSMEWFVRQQAIGGILGFGRQCLIHSSGPPSADTGCGCSHTLQQQEPNLIYALVSLSRPF